MTTIPPERFFEMSRALFQAALEENGHYDGLISPEMLAHSVGHLAGLAWLAYEAGEEAEREQKHGK